MRRATQQAVPPSPHPQGGWGLGVGVSEPFQWCRRTLPPQRNPAFVVAAGAAPDYRLLEDVKRADDVAKRCRPPGAKPQLPQHLANMVYQAQRRSVKLLIMPPGGWGGCR